MIFAQIISAQNILERHFPALNGDSPGWQNFELRNEGVDDEWAARMHRALFREVGDRNNSKLAKTILMLF